MEGKEPTPEIVSLDQMIELLGFTEDSKLQTIRAKIGEAKAGGESENTINELFRDYDDQAQSVLDNPVAEEYQRNALGLILAKARIDKEIGWEEYYQDQVDEALGIAQYADFVTEEEFLFISRL